MVRRAVLVPPDLHQTAGLVTRDLLREGTVEQARALWRRWLADGDETWCDLGDRGELAIDVTRRLTDFAPEHIELFVPRTHARAGSILRRTLAAAGAVPVVTTIEAAPGPAFDGKAPSLVPPRPDQEWLSGLDSNSGFTLGERAPATVEDRLASPLPPALHPHAEGWLDQLTAWLRRHRPACLAEWRCLLHAHDAHVNPVEAIYAGLHLRERNAELLVNIL
ncbi:MAG: hypothetical protein KDC98_24845 [Planctomycetes bacterium]|nr:hypothetical protein [Planctomycetota bacterium]